jgi:hypothetical protein
MNTWTNTRARVLTVSPLAGLLAVALSCMPATPEGSRCNPSLSHNECENDPVVQCTTPPSCLESYCCGPSSKQQVCQACPASSDGGDDGSSPSEAGAESGTD